MKSHLLERIRRLEQRPELAPPAFFRCGWLHAFPADYVGDRHVAVLNREPAGSPSAGWCEFEERPGPGPTPFDGDGVIVYLPAEVRTV